MNYEEQFRKLKQRDQDNIRKLAELQAPMAIGEAVLMLHASGQPVDVPALLVQLLEPVQALKPEHLRRLQAEAAARLLGWQP